jgi:hypothetical protein
MKTLKITISFCCFLILISTTAFCQKNKLHVINAEKILGKNLLNGSEIKGTEFVFPDKIHELFFEPETNFATVQLKGKKNSGNILQYDLKNKVILWSKPIYYDTDELLKFDNLLILNEYNEASVIDNHTGEKLSKVMNYIYFANPKYNIGFAYLYLPSGDGYYTNDFMGIDLVKRKLLWKRNINRKYGWNDYFYLNDSTLMVVASGLHTINIKTGEGWDYSTVTGEGEANQDLGMAFGFFGGMIGGLLGAVIGAAIGNAVDGGGITRDLVSNTLMSGAFIYFASKEKLVKIHEESGNIVWENSFPKDLASKSSLFMDDSVVYMVNYGYAIQNNRKVNYGKTFISAFDKLTGKEKYFSKTNNEELQTKEKYLFKTNKENDPIIDYKQIDNEIYLLFPNLIAKYSLETGNLISEKIFPQKDIDRFTNFADDKVFLLAKYPNSDLQYFFNLSQITSTELHIHTNQEKIVSIDSELNVTNTIGYYSFGINSLCSSNYKFITKDDKTFVIDYQGLIIAELDVTSNAFIIGNTIYEKRENSFIAISLKNLEP